jgi:hypothetical protein
LSLAGKPATTFRSPSDSLAWLAVPPQLDATSAVVTFDGVELQAPNVTASAGAINVTLPAQYLLSPANHHVSISASGLEDTPVAWSGALWFGNLTLTVTVMLPTLAGEEEVPAEGASVRCSVAQDSAVGVRAVTDAYGVATCSTLPGDSLFVSATLAASDYYILNVGVSADAGSVTLRLKEALQPSSIDNNDFHNGTAGWEASALDSIAVSPHTENVSALAVVAAAATSGRRLLQVRDWHGLGSSASPAS